MVTALPEIGRRAAWVRTEGDWREILLQAPGLETAAWSALEIGQPAVQLALLLFHAAPRALPMDLSPRSAGAALAAAC